MFFASSKKIPFFLRFLICLSILIAAAAYAEAEQLPIRTYTIADGLARDSIQRIVSDSHGFLWFCTSEGLSRFDGYRFTNYGKDHGLPNRVINDLLETRKGIYWAATYDGLYRFMPEAKTKEGAVQQSKFIRYSIGDVDANSVEDLIEDRAGVIWCGTGKGLYRFEEIQGQWRASYVDLHQPSGHRDGFQVKGLTEDRRGDLWISTGSGLYRLRSDGRIERYDEKNGLSADLLSGAIIEDRDGTIWLGSTKGLYRLVSDPQPDGNIVSGVWTEREGLPGNFINSLYQTSNGNIWATAEYGASEFAPPVGNKEPTFRNYSKAAGFNDYIISVMTEDRDGNLWFSSESGGAMKLSHNGLTSYDEKDGIDIHRIAALSSVNRASELCVIGYSNGKASINQFDGRRFIETEVALPQGLTYWGWGWNQLIVQDRAGEWWIPTGQGLVRYSRVERIEQLARARPKAIYTSRNGLPADEVFRLYEDARGDVWISVLGNPRSGLARWSRADESFQIYTKSDGVPEAAPTAFAEDAAGNLWMGFYTGGIARYSKGRFTLFTEADGLPKGFVRNLYVDGANRLWIATSEGGAARLDDLQAEQPKFVVYTTAQGLSSNQVTCVTEDLLGRIYLGTGRGLDRIEPTTGRVKCYTTDDGLANNFVNVSLRDREGALWFGTLQGLSRLIPQPDPEQSPPPVAVSGLRIAGVSAPLSELGETKIDLGNLEANANNLDIDYFGLSFRMGEALLYQHKLEGADSDWSRPAEQRTITFANLAPGSYRFLVRTVNADGASSRIPAVVAFNILSPVWLRWWVLTPAAILAASGLFAFYRYRAARLSELNAALAHSRESEMRFRTLAETASDAIITINEKSEIIFINAAAEQVFGYKTTEMIGRNLTMLMPEYLRHLHQAGFNRYVETGRRHISWTAIELSGLHKSGSEIPLEISFGEFARHGKRYFTGVVRDVTERKRSEESLRKAREERFAELERVRRRIATDLHDDIGSSLTQISILSEVLLRQKGDGNASSTKPLASIASASRELVDSMSDIVWAINPQKDHLSDLTRRMYRFAADSFTARNIKFQLQMPETETDLQLGANLRREIFLIFKESVNNMVRHSGCKEAEIDLRIEQGDLALTVRDDGRGFDPERESDGHGLVSMRDRAKSINGAFEMISQPECGTTVRLRVPLDGSLNADEHW